MSETARQLAVDAVAELYVERQRIAAVLADCDRVWRDSAADEGTHDPECWLVHTACLAVRVRRTLTGEGHPQ